MKLLLPILNILLYATITIEALPRISTRNENHTSSGEWKFVGKTGVSAMHMTLIRPTKVLIIDKAGRNPEALLSKGRYAYSTLYDLSTNTYRILSLHTNTFCSAGAYLANGTMVETGGAEDTFGEKNGFQSVRLIDGCDDKSCDWLEFPYNLDSPRWYNTMVTLPDGRVFNLGGSIKAAAINRKDIENPTFEFYPKEHEKGHKIQFLEDSFPYNLYPIVMVLPGPKDQHQLFLSANKKAQIWDYVTKETVKHLPDIPGGPRTYPLTGSGALLPLRHEDGYKAEILICGGGTEMKRKAPAEKTCERIDLSDENPQWDEEEFGHNQPTGRVMPDAIHLPNGKILFLNGAGQGFAGWDLRAKPNRPFEHTASLPTKAPLLYDPLAKKGSRWSQLAEDPIIRVYHSSATLLPDGKVFVAGSNPNINYCSIEDCAHPTEHRAEVFTPPYLLNGNPIPTITKVAGHKNLNGDKAVPVTYEQKISVSVDIDSSDTEFTASLSHMGFITHSQHMSARVVTLKVENVRKSESGFTMDITMPPNSNMFPPGRHNYLFVLNKGTPAKSAIELHVNL
ncbi:14512_t:CDS:2 [Funneliformis caledonium]|uniref:14512_t:CDS:1 n=1 Tax=Funneliformis caledonium TaxID=1117310 RepID=A0A9N9H8Q0_9GLOM|nr:14512_t:CDS:2 [Funneliformis caledonium]